MDPSCKTLSIIIPFFNSMKYIGDLLKSIPKDDQIEILIVDDKSDEAQSEALKQYMQKCDNDIRYIYNDGKKSAGTCRNIGIRNACGEWLLFADSDDYFVPGFLNKLEPWFDTSYDLVYFIPTSYERDNQSEGNRHLIYKEIIEQYLDDSSRENELELKTTFVVPWSKLYRKRYVSDNNILFDEVRASNDVMFSLKCAFQGGEFATSQDVIYCVTKNPGSLMYKVDNATLDARTEVYVRQYKFLESVLTSEEFEHLNMRGTSMIKRYISAGQSAGRLIELFLYLRKSGIKIFDSKDLKISRFTTFAREINNNRKKNKGYYRK